jgi:hypothetical protein
MIKYPFGLSPDELKRGPKDPNRVFPYIYTYSLNNLLTEKGPNRWA